MNQYVMETSNLSKFYQNIPALNNINLKLQRGKIYGLIGQNGAGKTTLMRMITGMSIPDSGTLTLFGQRESAGLQQVRKRLGSMVEYPSLNGNMTAKENMKLHRIMRGIPTKALENELLELVGLQNIGKKKTKNFSLGMKQRLGIAISLINNPEFLVLDEPINGLDPLGVVDIRNLLKKRCEERNTAILISSHNLPELYQVASDYIIIHEGEIKQTLTLAQLEERCQKYLLINCKEMEKLISVLEEKLGTCNYKVMPDKSIRLYDYLDRQEALTKALYENNVLITTLSQQGETLENYFIHSIGGEANV